MAKAIRIIPEELREASIFLDKKLDAMIVEAKSIKSKLDEIAVNWEGAAVNTFFDIFDVDIWPILNIFIPDLINGIINQLNGTANAFEAADQEIAGKLRG